MTALPDVWWEYAGSESIADPVDDGWTWTDCTTSVRISDGPSWSRGRQDERQQVGPGRCSFTVDYSSTWAPDGTGSVRIGTPVRARCMTATGNLVTNSTLETDATGWSGYGTPTPSVARSTAQAQQGSASLLVTWGTSGSAATQNALYQVTGLVVGRTYTVSAYVWVPVGKPAVKVGIWFLAASSASTTTGAWERLSVSFTATLSSLYVSIANAAATTSGDTCYVDAVMVEPGSSASAFTSSAPTMVPLFTGFVGSLRSSWVNGVHQVVNVTATDLMTWLARQETNAPEAAASGIESLSPVLWWPMDDPSGSLRLRQLGSATFEAMWAYQIGDDPGGQLFTNVDGLPAVTLSPAGRYVGWELGATGTATVPEDRTYAAHFKVAERPDADEYLSLVNFADASSMLSILVDSGGRLEIQTELNTEWTYHRSFPDVADNRWHHVAVVLDEIGTSSRFGMTVYLDGQAVSSDQGWSTTSPAGDTQTDVTAVSCSSGYSGFGMWRGSIANLCVFDTKLSQAQVRTAAGPLCSAGLDAGEAITALLAPTGVVPTTTGTFAETLGVLPEGTMLTSILAAADAERGIVHATASGTLEVQARSVRRSPVTALSLDNLDVSSDLSPQSDESDVVNDMTVSTAGGVSARRVDQTSIAAYGRRSQSTTLPLATASGCDDHAAWVVSSRGEPTVRIGSATVQATAKAATVDTATLLGLDLSDAVEITGLPGTPSSLDLFVEGVSGQLSTSGLTVTLNLSPQVSPDLIDFTTEGSLLAWWDARFPSGTTYSTADGALVRTMTDLTGNGHDAVAAGVVNLLWANLTDFETATPSPSYQWPGHWDALRYRATYARSTLYKHGGTYSGMIGWSSGSTAYNSAAGIWYADPQTVLRGVVPGAPYTVSAWVYVGSAPQPHVALGWWSDDCGAASTLRTTWERIYWHTYAQTAGVGVTDLGSHYGRVAGMIPIQLIPVSDGTGTVWVDEVMVEEGHVTPGTWTKADPSTLRPSLRYGAPGSSPTLETSLVGHVLPLDSDVTDSSPCTLYAVVRPDALDQWLLASSSTSGHLGLVTSSGQAKWRLRYGSDSDQVDSSAFASPVGSLCVLTVQVAAGGVVTFRHNGTAVGGGTDTGILGFDFDRLVGTDAAPWTGGIGAVLAYGDAHDSDTVARIERALALMWGVTLA